MALKRWLTMNKIFLVIIGLLVIFAYMDYKQVQTIREIDAVSEEQKWDAYWEHQQKATVIMWASVFIAIGIIWFFVSKDKSEALALAITPLILLFTGVQDLIYFAFERCMPLTLAWADRITSIRIVSDVLGEAEPTRTSFILTAIIGIVIAYFVYKYLRSRKW